MRDSGRAVVGRYSTGCHAIHAGRPRLAGRTDGKREGGTAHEKGERKKRTTQTQRWLNQEFSLANTNNAAGDVFTGRARSCKSFSYILFVNGQISLNGVRNTILFNFRQKMSPYMYQRVNLQMLSISNKF